MGAILISMVICFVFVLFGGIFGGFIFLSGLIVICTLYLAETIREEKHKIHEKRKLVIKRPIIKKASD